VIHKHVTLLLDARPTPEHDLRHKLYSGNGDRKSRKYVNARHLINLAGSKASYLKGIACLGFIIQLPMRAFT